MRCFILFAMKSCLDKAGENQANKNKSSLTTSPSLVGVDQSPTLRGNNISLPKTLLSLWFWWDMLVPWRGANPRLPSISCHPLLPHLDNEAVTTTWVLVLEVGMINAPNKFLYLYVPKCISGYKKSGFEMGLYTILHMCCACEYPVKTTIYIYIYFLYGCLGAGGLLSRISALWGFAASSESHQLKFCRWTCGICILHNLRVLSLEWKLVYIIVWNISSLENPN